MARVQVYSHSGVANYTADSFTVLKQPYIAREVITAGAEPLSTLPALTAAPSTKLLHVQIEPNKTVAIELNPQTRHVMADADSPRYRGNVVFEATVGCTLSILEILQEPGFHDR